MFVTFSKTKLKDFAMPLIIIVFMGLMLAFPEHYMKATGRGLALFASNVLPAMFPFLFLNTMLSNTKAIPFINKAFEKPVNKVFGVVKEGAFAFIETIEDTAITLRLLGYTKHTKWLDYTKQRSEMLISIISQFQDAGIELDVPDSRLSIVSRAEQVLS